MFDRFFNRKSRGNARSSRSRQDPASRRINQVAADNTTQPISPGYLDDLHQITPRPSVSSLPSYKSRDRDLPGYKYGIGHPLSTLDYLTVQAAAARPSPARRTQRPHPALCLAPYTAHGSPWRDVSVSSGWVWMPSRTVRAYRRLIPHDHPVHHMAPSEQARLRRMGIDPVAKAEFLLLQETAS